MDAATATLQADTWAVLLTASNPVGTVTWTRVTGGSEQVIGTGASLRDHPPLNVPCLWLASDDATTEETEPVTVEAVGALLNATDRNKALSIWVIRQPPLSWEARSTSHPIIGRRDPVVVIHPPTFASGELVVLLRDRNHRIELLEMFDSGAPLLLRTTRPAAVDDMAFLPVSWEDPLLSESMPAGMRLLNIKYQAVSALPPAWAPDPLWSYDAALAAYADYDALLAANDTYRALLIGPV